MLRALLWGMLALEACGGWSRVDTLGELGFLTVTAIDEGQTQTITAQCAELNPIIGACGERFGYYWPLAYSLHALISAALPAGARHWWQGITIGAEVTTVWRNYRDGY